jgi:uncharacterized lipoprotein YehR (DUF1307 family)
VKPLKILALLLALCLMLSGCRQKPETQQMPNLVTKIRVTYKYQDVQLERIYTDNQKMDIILYYLYSLIPGGQTWEDPEKLTGERCRIVVSLMGERTRIYRQFSGEYLSVDNRPWQKIDKEKAAVLVHLLRHIPGDV